MIGLRLIVQRNSSMVIHGSKIMMDGNNNNRLHMISESLLLYATQKYINAFNSTIVI